MGTSYHPHLMDKQRWLTDSWNRIYDALLWSSLIHGVSIYHGKKFSFNTGFHSSIETTPFKVVYGKDRPSISPFVHGETRIAELEEQLLNCDAMLKILKDTLLKAQTRMKQQDNSHRRDVTFQVGYYVFLCVHPYRQCSLAYRRCKQLSPRFWTI